MTIGERLKYLREDVSKISQNELARRAKIRRATISDLESGKSTTITLENAMRLARGLGVSMDIFTQGIDLDALWAAAADSVGELAAAGPVGAFGDTPEGIIP